MKSIQLTFRTQVEDQYQETDSCRWVSPLVLESAHNIYEVIVTACPSWDSASYSHTEDTDPLRTTISKCVGDAFTPSQVQELMETSADVVIKSHQRS